MANETRWPRFATEAVGLGVGAMMCFQLPVTGDNLGALNMYASDPGAFGEEPESIGLVFASHAAIAISAAQQQEHLRSAVDSRDLIGQAKGVLMERYKLTGGDAFAVLVRASSHTNRKLVDIAEELSNTGVIPTP